MYKYTQVYVLSPSLELVPHGVVGELYIGGVGLARGYLNRPEQTAQSFIDNPFYELGSVNNSQRIYKTGDLVRVNQAGHLSFVGRVDEQVKLRGFRIELGEIESALNALDGVEHSAVLTDDNGTQLLGYVSLEEGAQWQNDTLKAAIAQYLPEYMIPNFIDVLADMPLTRNGKIDKQSLSRDTRLDSLEYETPQCEAEQQLACIWGELLNIPAAQISRSANFFDLG